MKRMVTLKNTALLLSALLSAAALGKTAPETTPPLRAETPPSPHLEHTASRPSSTDGEAEHTPPTSESTPPENDKVSCALTVSATTLASTICKGQTVELTATASGGGGGKYTFQWSSDRGFADTVTVSTTQSTISDVRPERTEKFTVTVFNKSGACGTVSATGSVLITVEPALKVDANVNGSDLTTICFGESVTLTAAASGGDSVNYAYTWTKLIGDGAPKWTQSGDSLSDKPIKSGTTRYQVKVTDPSCPAADSATATVDVTVREPLSVAIHDEDDVDVSRSTVSICRGASPKLSARSQGGRPGTYTYTWSSDNGDSASNPNHTFNSSTIPSAVSTVTYTLELRDGCTTPPANATVTFNIGDALDVDMAKNPSRIICIGETVDLTARGENGNSNVYTYRWTSDKTTRDLSVADILSVSPEETTTYQVTVGHACTEDEVTDTVKVEVHPRLVVTPKATHDNDGSNAMCFGKTVQLGIESSSGGLGEIQYSWSIGGEVLGTETTPDRTHTPTATGKNTYTLTATDECLRDKSSYSTERTVDVQVKNPLTLDTIADQTVCYDTDVDIDAVANGGLGAAYEYEVQDSDGNEVMRTTSSKLLFNNLKKTDTYTLILTDGCSTPDTVTFTITVRGELKVVIEDMKGVYCENQKITLKAEVSGGSGGTYIYKWERQQGSNPKEHIATIPSTSPWNNRDNMSVPNTTTTYFVQVEDGECGTADDIQTVEVHPPLAVTASFAAKDSDGISDGEMCRGRAVTLSATGASGGNGDNEYTWKIKGGSGVGTGVNLEDVVPPASGTTTYEVTLKDKCVKDHGSPSATSEIEVEVHPTLSLTPIANQTVCHDASIAINASAGDGKGKDYTYKWEKGSTELSNTSSLNLDNLTAAQSGTYSVTVSDGCTAKDTTVEFNITVRGELKVDIEGGTSTYCKAQSFSLEAKPFGGSGSYTYQWLKSGVIQGGEVSSTYSPNAPGVATTYKVEVTDATCGTANDSQEIKVHSPLAVTADFAAKDSDGISDGEMCRGRAVELKADVTGGKGSYQYTWAANGTSLGTNIESNRTHTPTASGTTNYTVTVTDECSRTYSSSDSVTSPNIPVKVHPPLSLDAIPDQTICYGADTEIKASAGGGKGKDYTYEWKKGGVPLSTPTPPSTLKIENLTANTTYSVTVGDGCTAKGTTVEFTVNVDPPLSFALPPAPVTICKGQSTTLSASGAGGKTGATYTYAWRIQGKTNIVSNDANYTVSPTETTTYEVTLSDGGCTKPDAVDPVTVTVRPPLGVTAQVKQIPSGTPAKEVQICYGQSVALDVSSSSGGNGSYEYKWERLDAAKNVVETVMTYSSTADIAVSPTANTTYRLTIRDNCTTTEATDEVKVKVSPPLSFQEDKRTKDTTVCKGQGLTLNAPGEGGSGAPLVYSWTVDGVVKGDKSNLPLTNLSKTAIYKVTLNDGCTTPAIAEITVTVREPITVSISPLATVCRGKQVTLNPTVSGGRGESYYTYSWSVDKVSKGSTKEIEPVIEETTTFTLEVGDGCTVENGEATLTVTAHDPLGVTEILSTESTVCYGASIELTATPSGGGGDYYYTWVDEETGTKLSDTELNKNTITVTPTAAGEYTYSVELDDKCTKPKAEKTIIVTVLNPLVINNIKGVPPSKVCRGTALELTAQGEGGKGPDHHIYTWTNNIDGTKEVKDKIEPFGSTITVKTQYKVVLSDGCSEDAEESVPVEVHDLLSVDATADKSGTDEVTICKGQSVNLKAVGKGGKGAPYYTWSNDVEGSPKKLSSDTYNVSPKTTRTYTVVLSDHDDCTTPLDSATVVVTVRDALSASISEGGTEITEKTICKGQSVTLNALGNGGNVPAHSYKWEKHGDGTPTVLPSDDPSDESMLTVTPEVTTTYSVTLSDGGCTTAPAIAWVTITVLPPLEVAIQPSDTTICTGRNAPLKAVGTGGKVSDHSYTWFVGETAEGAPISGEDTADVEPTTTTFYTVQLVDGCTTLPATATIEVKVRDPLALDVAISPSKSTFCRGEEFDLQFFGTGGKTDAYTYTLTSDADAIERTSTDGLFSRLKPLHTLTYTVVLKDGCTTTDVTLDTTITVRDTLKVETNPNHTICSGQTTDLIAYATGGKKEDYSYTWTSNTDDTWSGANKDTITVQPSETTIYTIRLEDGCTTADTATDTIEITVLPPLQVNTNSDTTICKGQTASLEALASGGQGRPYTYTWTSSTDPSFERSSEVDSIIDVTPATTTVYTVVLSDGCTVPNDTAEVTVTVLPPLEVTLHPDTTICKGRSAALRAIGKGGNEGPYTYTLTNATTGVKEATNNDGNFVVTPPSTATYVVTMEDGCTVEPIADSVTVTVRPPLSLLVTSDDKICQGEKRTLAAVGYGGTGGPYKYTWTSDTDPTFVSGQTSIEVSPTVKTNYTVTLTDNCTVMAGEATVTIDIHDQPSVAISGLGTTLCQGTTTPLKAVVTGGTAPYTYRWNAQLGTDAPVYVASDTANYVAVVDANGCTDTASGELKFYPFLEVEVKEDTICPRVNFNLIAQASGGNGDPYTYSWYNHTTGATSSGNPLPLNLDTTTSYTVTVSDGCTLPAASKTVTPYIHPKPDIVITSDRQDGCVPLEVEFVNETNDSLLMTTDWNFGSAQTGKGTVFATTYTAAGCRDVEVTITTIDGCQLDTLYTEYICADMPPRAAFTYTPQETDLIHSKVTFVNNSTQGMTYHWSFGDGDSSQAFRPTHQYPDTIGGVAYPVDLSVTTAHNCTVKSRDYITIEEVPLFYTPNAIILHEKENPLFRPVFIKGFFPRDYRLQVYDRWGDLVFVTEDPNQGWDGTDKGGRVSGGVYVWRMQFRENKTHEAHKKFGYLTVVE